MTDNLEPPRRPVTGSPQLVKDRVAVVPSPGSVSDATIVQHFLRLGADPSTGGSASFMRWVIATTTPSVTVTVGHRERTFLLSMCDAMERTGVGTRCIAVGAGSGGSRGDGSARLSMSEIATSACSILEEFDSEEDAKNALGADASVDLLHFAIAGGVPDASDLAPWLEVLGLGASVYFTGSGEGVSEELDRIAKEVVPDHFRTVRVPLGIDGEALVAQQPIDGSSSSVDLLENVPSAVGSILTIFGGSAEAHGQIAEAIGLPGAAEALVGRLIERQQSERAAFLQALRTYQDLTMQLSDELSAACQGLTTQTESARLEREALVGEFLDRFDVLCAKISTSASKYSAELAEKDRQLEDAENRVLAYAGLAASAQSVVEDLRRSSSWRVTAPIRLFSGLVRRRAAIEATGG